MLRHVLLALARSERAERVLSSSPPAKALAGRFVAADAAGAVADLTDQGLLVSVDYLGADVTDRARAEGSVQAYLALLAGLPAGADVSVRPTALGLRLSEQLALDNAATICEAAASRGVTVTLDAEEHDTVEALMSIHATLRKEHPGVGVVVQAYLREAAERCRRLEGARVRLCKGAYEAPEALRFGNAREVDRSFVRCLRILMNGSGHPVVATDDRRLIEITSALAVLSGREPSAYEHQLPRRVRPAERHRLTSLGLRVRVEVPYGPGWYPYLMRRLAEHPADLAWALLPHQ